MENISEKKKAIFESTLELIQEHGFHGAPMSQVAKNAGVAAGTIYHYFESKDELIRELYVYNKSRVVDIVAQAIEGNATYKEKFYKIWQNLYEFYIQNPNVLIFFEQFVNSPFNTNKCPNHFQGELFEFFKNGQLQKEIKNIRPEILMILTLGSISSTAKIHKFGNIPVKKAELTQITEILWEGIAVK